MHLMSSLYTIFWLYLYMYPHVSYPLLHTFMTYSLSSIMCIRVETVTPEQEELEPEIVGDSTPVETQGRPLSISYTLFWINEVYVSCLRMSYNIYH